MLSHRNGWCFLVVQSRRMVTTGWRFVMYHEADVGESFMVVVESCLLMLKQLYSGFGQIVDTS